MSFAASRILLVMAAAILYSGLAAPTFAQQNDPCPNQGRISTGTGQDSGFPVGSKICPGDSGQKQLYGGCDQNPYDLLETNFKSGSNVQITPRTDGNGSPVGGIDSALACRLTKFLEASRQRGCNPKIISAYRSAQQQQDMCGAGRSGCAPAGASCHQYGLAIDVSASCIGWMRMAAPQFQLVFPYYGDHIQCAEHPSASRRSCTGPCNGGIAINPNLSTLPHPSQVPDTYFVPPAPVSPTSGLTNQFRQAMGLPQQPTIPTTPASSPSPITSNLAQPTQSNFCLPEYKCSGNTLLYQNSFCATQTQQVCPSGCVNGACVAATSTATSTNTNENTNTNTDTSTSSAIDIIGTLSGYSATTTSIGTSTPLQLLLSITQDQSQATARPGINPLVGVLAPGSIANMQLVGAQQTFTSPDLNQNMPPVRTQERSALFTILENMKQVLLKALEYLRPFSLSHSLSEQQQSQYTTE